MSKIAFSFFLISLAASAQDKKLNTARIDELTGIKGKLKPTKGAVKELLGSIPTVIRAIKTGKARSLSKLIPGIHPKLPDGAQDEVQAIYKHTEEHSEEFNIYIRGEEDVEPEPDEPPDATVAAEATAPTDKKGES